MGSKLLSIIIIIILILLVFYIIFLLKPIDNEPFYHYDDIKKRLKTGDIILFSCKQHGSLLDNMVYSIRTTLVNSEYGHAGIVIKNKKGKLFIVEACGPSQCGYENATHLNNDKKGGARIIELDKILQEYYEEYKGIYAVKFISKEIPYSVIMEKLKKYENIRFQDRHVLAMLVVADICISNTLAKTLSKYCDEKKMICTDFLYDLLYECNVVKEYPSKIFWPHLITSKKFDDLQIINYSKPYKFSIVNNKDNDKKQDNE